MKLAKTARCRVLRRLDDPLVDSKAGLGQVSVQVLQRHHRTLCRTRYASPRHLARLHPHGQSAAHSPEYTMSDPLTLPSSRSSTSAQPPSPTPNPSTKSPTAASASSSPSSSGSSSA